MPFAARPRPPSESSGVDLLGLVTTGLKAAADTVGLVPHLAHVAEKALRQTGGPLPGTAPRSMLNVPITGSRRFAADSWDLARIRTVARAADATVNDVVLAMSASALRDYLLSHDALPDAPLIAMTPVSLRDAADSADDAGGNAVGAILADLGTHLEDPAERLVTVRDSMRQGKANLKGLSQLQIAALSAATMSPLLVNSLVGVPRFVRPPFNLVISNVPGPRDALYWNGAKLDQSYPLSIPTQGQALNITVTSYDGRMHFGLVGCRRSVPHLQQLLAGLEDGLVQLEKIYLNTQ
jgi:diacylglycerol O-acyltransferase